MPVEGLLGILALGGFLLMLVFLPAKKMDELETED